MSNNSVTAVVVLLLTILHVQLNLTRDDRCRLHFAAPGRGYDPCHDAPKQQPARAVTLVSLRLSKQFPVVSCLVLGRVLRFIFSHSVNTQIHHVNETPYRCRCIFLTLHRGVYGIYPISSARRASFKGKQLIDNHLIINHSYIICF